MGNKKYVEDLFLKEILGDQYNENEIRKAKKAAKNDMKGETNAKKDRTTNK